MRVSRLVSAPNWHYAVGEIVLIVVGVTVALAATSWYEGQQEQRDEIVVLQQLRQTLSEDLQEIGDLRVGPAIRVALDSQISTP